MNRARLPQIHSITDGSFEPNRRNPIMLGDDSQLGSELKPIKIGGLISPLEISENEIRLSKHLECQSTATFDGIIKVGGGSTSELFASESGMVTIGEGAVKIANQEIFQASNNLYLTSPENVYFYAGNQDPPPNGVDYLFRSRDIGDEAPFQTGYIGMFSSSPAADSTILYLYGQGGKQSISAEFSYIQIGENSATVFGTWDLSGGGEGHLTVIPNGDLILDPSSQKTIINATDGLYFDGGTDTYITESAGDILDFYVGGTILIRLFEGVANYILLDNADVAIDATKKLFFDGGILGNTSIYEASADSLRIVVGGDIMMQLSEKGDDGNEVNFASSCVGFTQIEPTYDATTTVVDFRHSNKQFVTFGAGNITNVNLTFPLVSGNFVLLVKQDAAGSRTITNYKAMEFDESAADGSAAVKFAGGSNPTLTTDANHVDILSFYWDADNEIAYGVATLDFQF